MTPVAFSGQVVKIGYHDEVEVYLQSGSLDRPMGRYNSRGQDAFYASENLEAAKGALRNFTPDPTRSQVLLTYIIKASNLFDIRALSDGERSRFLDPWKPKALSGERPTSWDAADKVRADGFDGLLDPSRANPHLFHLVLFNWNRPQRPRVQLFGEPASFE